jgi:hypothetical protein
MAMSILGLGLQGMHSLYSLECGSDTDIIGKHLNVMWPVLLSTIICSNTVSVVPFIFTTIDPYESYIIWATPSILWKAWIWDFLRKIQKVESKN